MPAACCMPSPCFGKHPPPCTHTQTHVHKRAHARINAHCGAHTHAQIPQAVDLVTQRPVVVRTLNVRKLASPDAQEQRSKLLADIFQAAMPCSTQPLLAVFTVRDRTHVHECTVQLSMCVYKCIKWCGCGWLWCKGAGTQYTHTVTRTRSPYCTPGGGAAGTAAASAAAAGAQHPQPPR